MLNEKFDPLVFDDHSHHRRRILSYPPLVALYKSIAPFLKLNILPDEDDGLGHLSASPEKSIDNKIVRKGNLGAFLTETFLAGTSRENSELNNMPQFINQLLAPLFTKQYVKQVISYGSVPKAIAEGGTPPVYWLLPSYFKKQADHETNEKVRPTLGKLSVGPRDIDFKFLITEAQLIGEDPTKYVTKFAKLLIHHHGFQESLFENTEILAGNHKDTVRRYLPKGKIIFGNYALDISFGTNPDLPQRENIEIRVFNSADLQNDQASPIFFIHLGLIPVTHDEVTWDLRKGSTDPTQDLAVVNILSDGQYLSYQMTQSAVEIMERKSEFYDLEILRQKSLYQLLEGAVRMLRTSLFKEKQYLEETHLNNLIPLIDIPSLRHFRMAMLEKFIIGNEEIDSDILNAKVLLRELYLSFTINPYLTSAFIRDSLLSLFFPNGLSDRKSWNNLLRSHPLKIAASEHHGVISVTHPRYLSEHIETYRSSNKFDGLSRVVQALLESNSNLYTDSSVWSKFYLLIHNSETFFNTQKRNYQEIAKKAETTASKIMEDSSVPKNFLNNIDSAILLTTLNIFYFAGNLGITAKEIAELVKAKISRTTPEITNEPVDISNELLALKLAGIINKESAYYYDRNGNKRRMDFYRIIEHPAKTLSIASYFDDGSFIHEFQRLYQNRFRQHISHKQLNRLANKLKRLGINSSAVLESLTKEDFSTNTPMKLLTSKPDDCINIIYLIRKAIKTVEQNK